MATSRGIIGSLPATSVESASGTFQGEYAILVQLTSSSGGSGGDVVVTNPDPIPVEFAVAQNVVVTTLPEVIIDSTIPVNVAVSNFPATQPISGSVGITGTPAVTISGTLPAFAATPAFTISGTLPAFAATPSVNATIVGTLPAFAATPAFTISGTLPAFAATPAVTISGTLPAFAATPAVTISGTPAVTISGTLPAFAATPTVIVDDTLPIQVESGNGSYKEATFLITNSGTYAAGDVVGGLITLAVTHPANGGILSGLRLTDDDNQKAQMMIYVHNLAPTTIADNAPYAPTINDLKKIIYKQQVLSTDWTTINGNAVLILNNIDRAFAGTSIYVYLVTDSSTPTYNANPIQISVTTLH